MSRADSYEDHELIRLIKQKDPSACHWLYEKYAGALYTFITEAVPRVEERNKILEESFTRVYNSIGQFNPVNKRLFTWMLSIAREIVITESKLHPGELRSNGNSDLGRWTEMIKTKLRNNLSELNGQF